MIKNALQPYQWLRSKLKKNRFTFEELKSARLSFSQFGEDLLLESFFGKNNKNGFYVDIGAFNPIRISNTHLFYKKGWTGINIEPNPEHFEKFRIERQNDINLNLAISDKKSIVEFSCDGAYSGINDTNYPHRNRNKDAGIIEVKTAPLGEILEQYLPKGQSIDFMTIDCEGHDSKVVKSNDWNKYRPKVVLVEQHGPSVEGDIYNHLTKNGYRFYCKIGFTLSFILDKESEKHLPQSLNLIV